MLFARIPSHDEVLIEWAIQPKLALQETFSGHVVRKNPSLPIFESNAVVS
jgi:hypothetical protein